MPNFSRPQNRPPSRWQASDLGKRVHEGVRQHVHVCLQVTGILARMSAVSCQLAVLSQFGGLGTQTGAQDDEATSCKRARRFRFEPGAPIGAPGGGRPSGICGASVQPPSTTDRPGRAKEETSGSPRHSCGPAGTGPIELHSVTVLAAPLHCSTSGELVLPFVPPEAPRVKQPCPNAPRRCFVGSTRLTRAWRLP